MTLRELQKHVNETVAANDAAGNCRNDMRVALEMVRNTKTIKIRAFELALFYRGCVEHNGTQYGAEIKFYEREEIAPPKKG